MRSNKPVYRHMQANFGLVANDSRNCGGIKPHATYQYAHAGAYRVSFYTTMKLAALAYLLAALFALIHNHCV